MNLNNILPHDKPMILIDDLLEIDMKNQFVKTSVVMLITKQVKLSRKSDFY